MTPLVLPANKEAVAAIRPLEPTGTEHGVVLALKQISAVGHPQSLGAIKGSEITAFAAA
jgi:hypothetical protein